MDDDMSDISPQVSRAPQPQLELKWTTRLAVSSSLHTARLLPGDKTNLPPSALEAILAAAPTTAVEPSDNRSYTSTFDPFNPYTFAAERAARAQFQDRQPQLPHPLTFRIVNPQNSRIVYAGVREFSAPEGEIELSEFLKEALDIRAKDEDDTDGMERSDSEDGARSNGFQPSEPHVTIHAAQLPKGTFVKLRPLEAGYDHDDWKALLEQYLNNTFTTLTNGEVLTVPGGKSESMRFLIDGFQPSGDAICIVDTDIEVDIEALNEEQARETLKLLADKARTAPGTEHGSSMGGDLSIYGKTVGGQVVGGGYVDYQITSWPRDHGVEIEVQGASTEDEIDLYVSPYGARQRVRPREDEHLWSETGSRYPKRIRLSPTNVELENAEALYISVHAFPPSFSADSLASSAPRSFTLRASIFDSKHSSSPAPIDTSASDVPPNPGDVQCKNCRQWVPSSSLILHENFCLRNNILCTHGCGRVFQKRSDAFKNHWHCDQCPDPAQTYGDTPLSRLKHDTLTHTSATCPSPTCGMTFTSSAALARHRVTDCAGKPILCQFCHLQVAQGAPADPSELAECLLGDYTPHELRDGARTADCHLCARIVRLRDMRTHLLTHEMEKKSRPAPRVCRNAHCGRTLDGVSRTGDTRVADRAARNEIALCATCFGPLYVTMHDPEGKALRRRVERRYLTQLLQGCGKGWCQNTYCKTGRGNQGTAPPGVTTKDALPMIRPYLDGLLVRVAEGDEGRLEPLHFCVDEASQKRRALAEMLAAEKVYGFEWCVAALEAEGGKLDAARAWLDGWAPKKVWTRVLDV